jgi:hypothetical protein
MNGLLKSNRECNTPGEHVMLLPLRTDRIATQKRFAQAAPDPYRHDTAELDLLFDESIYFKEHQARFRRDVMTNEKAHEAWENRKQADRFATARLKMTGAVAAQAAVARAAEAHNESPGKKDRPSSEEISDSDDPDQANKNQMKESKEAETKTKRTSEDGGDDNDNNELARATSIDVKAVRMLPAEAEKIVRGTMVEIIREEAMNGKKLRMLSPFDQKRHWNNLQERALELLIQAIREKNKEMVSATLTFLGNIGVKPKNKIVKVELTKDEKEVLNKFKPPTPRKEPARNSLTILLEKLGPLMDVNRILHEGISPLHVAAAVGSVEIMKILVDAWGADLDNSIHGYSVFQHALNSVSKGITDEKALDWLQIRGANTYMNPCSKVGKYCQEFVDKKATADKIKEDEKLAAKKAKERAKKKSRKKKASAVRR